ncbi:cache domain-containing sensor histidine kinase [Paenibacillus mucilaginosus]|uniref:Multi-sensor signal transduction histidine kinase n=1 Tax=Paenibacillus mucilaginosus (strain KNP414) TaxID=1036673 RepID=F8FEY6_PAEMK|nr:sensor histidine kinase [Paenibacillus mucilaginosus]AEI46221.1 multi-sensor signal transduction histidine kinase [Paenibacillus mucilaginosus KNP414]MCG7213652.1 sensor histidine kinase [Paenibacillus mucilaginosus]WDM27541.1 sensor histidine kinase [Paenibacillus mucilaginosus]
MRLLGRPLPIFVQLLAGMFVIAVLVIALTNMFNYRLTSQLVMNRTAGYTQESVEQLSAKIDVLLRQYDQFSQMLAFDPRVQDALTAPAKGGPFPDPLELGRYMAEKARYLANDMLVHLFDRDGRIYASSDALQLFWRQHDEVSLTPWYGRMSTQDGRMLWVYGPAWRDGEIPAIIGARKVKDRATLETVGDQFIVFPVEKINRIIGETGQRVQRKVQVMDRSGNIVYSTEPREIGTAADVALYSRFGGSTPPFFEWRTREEQQQVYVTYAKSAYSGWTVIAYFPKEAFYGDARQMWMNVLVTMAAGAGIALVLTAFYSWTLTRPIRRLAEGLNRVGRGRLLPVKRRFASRELTQLYANYNGMVAQLDEVIQRLSEQQISEQRARLVALKAQFRPHFLYNSLNLIYWTIEDGRREDAQEMTLALSDLLRYSVHPSSELVPLREDLEQLERYLLLQRARYRDQFTVLMDVDEGLEDQPVPRLLLQPLVENAFHHGLENKDGGEWLLRVAIRAEGSTLHCSVEDNGAGLGEAQLKELEQRIRTEAVAEESGRGIGLPNLHRQIGAFFGEPHGLRLSHSPLGGLRVELTLPLNGIPVGRQPIEERRDGGAA